jgi:hypothetical protein
MPIGPTTFSESSGESWSKEREELLQKKIKDLGLKLEGTRLEMIVGRLYQELGAAGIKIKPKVYLSDEWSCPDGVPIIGIPFYLADQKLSRIEDEIMEGIEAETDEEILRYLRHEAGHAINYAYRLYDTDEWHQLFGPYSRPYQDDYTPNPFSRNFVRHISGWYAQKHPDEDFAETFAVWLTPDSGWREAYRDWGCYKKLLYVDRIIKEIGQADPKVTGADYDMATEELGMSVAEHYKKTAPSLVELPAYFDGDLKEVFEARVPKGKEAEWEPASKFLARHRREIMKATAYWTGLHDVLVRSLISHFVERSKLLGLWVDPRKSSQVLTDLVAFSTTLCMNKLYKGDFIIK